MRILLNWNNDRIKDQFPELIEYQQENGSLQVLSICGAYVKVKHPTRPGDTALCYFYFASGEIHTLTL